MEVLSVEVAAKTRKSSTVLLKIAHCNGKFPPPSNEVLCHKDRSGDTALNSS
jgi:hypothetical protein